ncbi:30S ribosomal protein S20 [Fundidesulfovibrio putealis]|uniref:30S ribosomal protein S20 n=1 Tax=Fundidesulfovibrio putealis TaxID=270496 RepID=UPI0004805441|nr:30S ribosomal protein S20 [Fundidesulfovibrio putealis]
MANHKSALKRHRQSLVARARNRSAKTQVKNVIKAVRAAIDLKDAAAAKAALQEATAVLDSAASKKIVHWKTAARKVSRLNLAVNKIEA